MIILRPLIEVVHPSVAVYLGLFAGLERFLLASGAGKVFIERLTTQRQVLLNLVARHEQRRADSIERAGAAIRRQIAGLDLDAEQIADRVAIFTLVESPQDNAASLIAGD